MAFHFGTSLGGVHTLDLPTTSSKVTLKVPLKPFVISMNGIYTDESGDIFVADILPNQQSTDYTLSLSDRGKSVDTTANVVVPNDSDVNFPIGSVVTVTNLSENAIAVRQGSGVIIRESGTTLTGDKQLLGYGFVKLRKVMANTWYAVANFGMKSVFSFNKVISVNTLNYNVKTDAIAAGWDQVTPLDAIITVNSGVIVGSVSTGSAAFSTGASLPVGSALKLINNGTIMGAGGNGGNGVGNGCGGGGNNGSTGGLALSAQQVISITNNGTIAGGGGGGGSGYVLFNTPTMPGGSAPYAGSAGGGGGGQGSNGGNGGQVSYCNCWPWGGGSSGSPTSPGGGSPNTSSSCSGVTGGIVGTAGGSGGGLGSSGQNGVAFSYCSRWDSNGFGYTVYYTCGSTSTAQTSGGAAGACTQGNSNITWITNGTRLGALN